MVSTFAVSMFLSIVLKQKATYYRPYFKQTKLLGLSISVLLILQ